jgi:hypothetical protein
MASTRGWEGGKNTHNPSNIILDVFVATNILKILLRCNAWAIFLVPTKIKIRIIKLSNTSISDVANVLVMVHVQCTC